MTYSLHTLQNDAPAAAEITGFRRFAQEIALTVGFVFMAFWFLALVTHSVNDPAWTTSGTAGTVHNWGGRLGAWLGDLSFFLFGYSVWWCFVAALLSWLAALEQRLRTDSEEQDPPAPSWIHTRWAFWAGLVILMLASTGLEWTRLYRFEDRLARSEEHTSELQSH